MGVHSASTLKFVSRVPSVASWPSAGVGAPRIAPPRSSPDPRDRCCRAETGRYWGRGRSSCAHLGVEGQGMTLHWRAPQEPADGASLELLDHWQSLWVCDQIPIPGSSSRSNRATASPFNSSTTHSPWGVRATRLLSIKNCLCRFWKSLPTNTAELAVSLLLSSDRGCRCRGGCRAGRSRLGRSGRE